MEFLLFGILGSFFVSVSNLIIINPMLFGIENKLYQFSIFFIFQVCISFMFYHYYTRGYSFDVTYPVLITTIYGFGIISSFFVNFFILKQNLSFQDLTGIAFIVVGILIFIFKK